MTDTGDTSNKNIKILIVDDSKIIRLLLLQRLNDLGYENCVMAKSGDEAVKIAREADPVSYSWTSLCRENWTGLLRHAKSGNTLIHGLFLLPETATRIPLIRQGRLIRMDISSNPSPKQNSALH